MPNSVSPVVSSCCKANAFHGQIPWPVAQFEILITQNALHFEYNRYTMPGMSKTKISTLNLRVNPAIKEAVREAAAIEHRSVANMVEVLIRRHCESEGIRIPEQSAPLPRNEHG